MKPDWKSSITFYGSYSLHPSIQGPYATPSFSSPGISHLINGHGYLAHVLETFPQDIWHSCGWLAPVKWPTICLVSNNMFRQSSIYHIPSQTTSSYIYWDFSPATLLSIVRRRMWCWDGVEWQAWPWGRTVARWLSWSYYYTYSHGDGNNKTITRSDAVELPTHLD